MSFETIQQGALQVEMAQAVAAACGWDNLDLGYGSHAAKQGELIQPPQPDLFG